MISFSSPLWLLGLGILPAIWWLHRFRQLDSAIWVSALFLWKQSATQAASGGTPTHADPRWLLRACLYSILLFALAGPRLPVTQSLPVMVWFDTSPSMHVIENGRSRISTAIDMLVGELQQSSSTQRVVRSLGNHASATALAADTPGKWKQFLTSLVRAQAPQPLQTPAALNPEFEHWVVTDGADPEINNWLQDAPVRRVILSGNSGENTAITLLSIRRSLNSAEKMQGVVTIQNTGNRSNERQLEILADGQILFSQPLILNPGADLQHHFSLPASTSRITARLSPGDALQLDDELEIPRALAGKITVLIDDSCGRNLRAALAANPGLALSGQEYGKTGLIIDCTGTTIPRDLPAIVFHSTTGQQPVTSPVQWHGSSDSLYLDPSWLAVTDKPSLSGNHLPVLIAGNTPLLLASTPPGIIEVFIDMDFRAWINRPEYPVFVSKLVDLALGQSSLDPVVTARHAPRESRIQPQLVWHAGETPPAGQSRRNALTDFSTYLIALAILLLLLDIRISRPLQKQALPTQ